MTLSIKLGLTEEYMFNFLHTLTWVQEVPEEVSPVIWSGLLTHLVGIMQASSFTWMNCVQIQANRILYRGGNHDVKKCLRKKKQTR